MYIFYLIDCFILVDATNATCSRHFYYLEPACIMLLLLSVGYLGPKAVAKGLRATPQKTGNKCLGTCVREYRLLTREAANVFLHCRNLETTPNQAR